MLYYKVLIIPKLIYYYMSIIKYVSKIYRIIVT